MCVTAVRDDTCVYEGKLVTVNEDVRVKGIRVYGCPSKEEGGRYRRKYGCVRLCDVCACESVCVWGGCNWGKCMLVWRGGVQVPPSLLEEPNRAEPPGPNAAANPTCRFHAWGLPPVERNSGGGASDFNSHFPQRPPQIPGSGRIGAADCPGRLPAPAAAVSTPGRRRRLLERVASPGGEAAGALETPP